MFIKFLLIIIGATFFISTGCHTASTKEPVSQPLATVTANKETILFTGEWNTVANNIWLNGKLTFRPDGTFSYYTRGCLGHTFTEGNWYKANDVVELKSFERYKDSSASLAINNLRRDTTKEYIGHTNFRLINDSMIYVSGDTSLRDQLFQKVKETGEAAYN